MEPRDIFVGLGSNIEPHANVPKMLEGLLRLAPWVDVSPIVVTEPVNIEGGGQPFLNAAARVRTDLSEIEVKEYFNAVEVALGRDRSDVGRKVRDRTADLDILFTAPVPAARVPDLPDLPTEEYLRPQLDALLAYVGLSVAASGTSAHLPGDLPTVTLDFHGVTIGPRCITLRRSAHNLSGAIMTDQQRPAALVTGGAVRLGRALAVALADAGYDIALHYGTSADAAASTAAEIRARGAACETFACDLTDVSGLGPLMAGARAAFPRLAVLVNSASAYEQAPIAETTAEVFAQQFDVNLRAPFFLTQAFATQVAQGNVVNIIDNKIGYHQFAYAAYLLSKKALAEFTAMAAVEFAPQIRVNGVAPGVVLPATSRSPEYIAWRLEGIPLQMQGETAHIAAAVLSLLANEFITGQVLTVDGGESLAGVGRNAALFDQSKV